MTGPGALPGNLEISPALLDAIEESLDVPPAGESKFRPLRIGQLVDSDRGRDLLLEDLIQMPPVLALGLFVVEQPTVEILPLHHRGLEIEMHDGGAGGSRRPRRPGRAGRALRTR